MTASLDALAWPPDGLLPVVIVDARTGGVLTLAYANRDALERTIATRETHLFSRSRGALWRKGETSGHTQRVVGIDADCDRDALVYRVLPNGPACHTGAASCFHEPVAGEPADGEAGFGRRIELLAATIAERKANAPPGSYTASLFASGVARIAQKVGEEAVETVIAAMKGDTAELTAEAADLVYHTLVLLAERGVSLEAVGAELTRRSAPSR